MRYTLETGLKRWISALALVVVLVAGCALPAPGPSDSMATPTVEPPTQIGFKVVAAEVEREGDPDVPPADLAALAEGQNRFAFDLYQAIRDGDDNLFYSPYSLATALAMTYAGARGETAAQMAQVLNFTLPQAQLHAAMNALAQELQAQDSLTLTVANSLWAQESYAFLDEYLEALARHYGAGVRLVDYTDPVGREAGREAINRWVEDETAGRIDELITEGMLTHLTRLVLANAIYFHADWQVPFLLGTSDGTFYLLDGSQVTVPLMSRRTGTPHTSGESYQAVELPYEGGRARMLVIVPDEGAFREIEASLDAAFIETLIEDLATADIELTMPKFSYDARLTLKPILIEMGMEDAFDADRADFSGMDGTRQLLITDVAHEAFVAVDEEGTEAAAATGVVVGIESMPVEVRVDRPFIYLIYDAELDLLLFVGRVLNPAPVN